MKTMKKPQKFVMKYNGARNSFFNQQKIFTGLYRHVLLR
jgi:hypothetical protein